MMDTSNKKSQTEPNHKKIQTCKRSREYYSRHKEEISAHHHLQNIQKQRPNEIDTTPSLFKQQQ